MVGKRRLIGGLVASFLVLWAVKAKSQTPVQIIDTLQGINLSVANLPCNAGSGRLISYKAISMFLSNKVSSYLSDMGDLSLYKNYVTIDAAKGVIAINHNLHQPAEGEARVKSFTIVGARAGFANAYAARFSNAFATNQLGISIQQVWMGESITKYNGCGSQKHDMDAKRALLVQQLATEIMLKASAFKNDLAAITADKVPGQNLQTAKDSLFKNFYTALAAEYRLKFAAAESDLLINSNKYNAVVDNWTSVSIYLPVIPQKFDVITGTIATKKYNYPLQLSVVHTWFRDAPAFGKLFMSVGAGLSINNAAQAGKLTLSSPAGTYTGNYSNFLTPVVSGKLVYLPPDSHVGLSARLEKNFGSYQAVNGIIGIPIVLIDKKTVPAVNFECQLILDDIGRSVKQALPGNRTSVGLTVGIPFSKMVY